jgi:hypothetical protein
VVECQGLRLQWVNLLGMGSFQLLSLLLLGVYIRNVRVSRDQELTLEFPWLQLRL